MAEHKLDMARRYRIGDIVEFIDEENADIFPFPKVGATGEVVGVCRDGDLKVVWSVIDEDFRDNTFDWLYCSPKRVRPFTSVFHTEDLNDMFSDFE